MTAIIREAQITDYKKLPGSFWVMAVFFNPVKSAVKVNNYRYFFYNLCRQGVKLLTIECALEGADFELKATDSNHLIQVRSNSVLWHKERLLNIGLKHLPADCDKIAWLDADIVFLKDNWANEAAVLLEKYHFVKPFKRAIRLNKNETTQILSGESLAGIDLSRRPKYKNNQYDADKEAAIIYMSVFGLCARRKNLQAAGFYDKFIIGNGDMIMSSAILQEKAYRNFLPPALEKDIEIWMQAASEKIGGKGIACLEGDIIHLFHGRMIHRNYYDRIKVLKKNQFDPDKDLRVNNDDCWEWGSDKKKLHKQLLKYFKNRNEDDALFSNVLIFCRYKITKSFIYFCRFLEKQIGLIGIWLKKNFPKIYYFLKTRKR